MTSILRNRRDILKLGLSAAALPFVFNLESMRKPAFGSDVVREIPKRLVILFSPNGIIPQDFWPDTYSESFEVKRILEPLGAYRDRMLLLHGVCDKVRGDGDNHMRGIGCLLTGIELYPGNIQGGSHTPAGWASGLSIDQEIKRYLQSQPATQTRFGSLEFGVVVPERADTWTRMVYDGPNRPVAPIDHPKQMFDKLYGNRQNEALVASILDDVRDDLRKIEGMVSAEDRRLLNEHVALVESMEKELKANQSNQSSDHPIPQLDLGIQESNDNIPLLSKMQIDLMVSSFLADFNRVATLQFTNSVGQARMRWLNIEESHHELSHESDENKEAVEKLVKINRWYCEQMAYLVQRLAETLEPNGNGSMLDNTTIVWTNELGKGNSHTLDNIPWVVVGGGLGFKAGRAIDFKEVNHNRFLLSLAHGMGHHINTFGNPDYCQDGPLALS